MFSMSDISIALKLTERSYTFTFKNTSLNSVPPNPLDMLLRQD